MHHQNSGQHTVSRQTPNQAASPANLAAQPRSLDGRPLRPTHSAAPPSQAPHKPPRRHRSRRFWTVVIITLMTLSTITAGVVANLGGLGVAKKTPWFEGGTVTYADGYRIHTFTESGTLTMVRPGNVEALVVAGGGGGGGSNDNVVGGAGGGAGGVLTSSALSITGTETVTVGAGGTAGSGASGSNGGNSFVGSLLVASGGGGGGRSKSNGLAGGSGGGGGGAGADTAGVGGAGTAGQGHNGGNGGDSRASAGGGGASAAGANGGAGISGIGGKGGDGIQSSISGTATYYGGGGGGGANSAGGSGGLGGGGNGKSSAGTPNTGGGGGGSIDGIGAVGYAGGSGIVIVRYPATASEVNSESKVSVSSTQKGLVGHWKFDGDAKDSSGYYNHGTVNGATLATDRQGVANKAYNFDGVNDSIDIGDVTTFDGSTEITVSAWIKPNGLPTGSDIETIIAKAEYSGSGANSFFLRLRGTEGVRAAFSDGSQQLNCDTLELPPDNTWTLITALLTTSDVCKIYFNSTEKITQTGSLTTGLVNVSAPFLIGRSSWATPDNFSGQIDDVRVYNRAITLQEISDMHSSYNPVISVSSLQKGMIGRWTFEGDAKDKTPYYNHGTVTGALPTADRFGRSNAAYNFDGVDDFISVPESSILLPANQLTLSAWHKSNGDGSNGARGILVSKNANYLDRCGINGPLFSLRISGTQRLLYAGSCAAVGEWVHYVGTYDGSTMRLYLNGVEVGTASYSGTITDDADPLTIGEYDSGSFNVDGVIDDVRVWNRALSVAEIQRLYDSY